MDNQYYMWLASRLEGSSTTKDNYTVHAPHLGLQMGRVLTLDLETVYAVVLSAEADNANKPL